MDVSHADRRLASDSEDPHRDAAYLAEECFREIIESDGDLPHIEAAELDGWLSNIQRRAGLIGGASPTFAFDVTDEDDLAAWHQGHTGAIHLHPRLIHPVIVLHEVAHWIRPADGHGAQWAAVFVGLIGAGLGEQARVELLEAFRDCGVPVDESWMATP